MLALRWLSACITNSTLLLLRLSIITIRKVIVLASQGEPPAVQASHIRFYLCPQHVGVDWTKLEYMMPNSQDLHPTVLSTLPSSASVQYHCRTVWLTREQGTHRTITRQHTLWPVSMMSVALKTGIRSFQGILLEYLNKSPSDETDRQQSRVL